MFPIFQLEKCTELTACASKLWCNDDGTCASRPVIRMHIFVVIIISSFFSQLTVFYRSGVYCNDHVKCIDGSGVSFFFSCFFLLFCVFFNIICRKKLHAM